MPKLASPLRAIVKALGFVLPLARDISWPIGAPDILNQIEQRIEQLGGRVIREPQAAGGRHWHVDW